MKIGREGIKSWLKEPLNLTLVLVLTIGVVLRLYYFVQTVHQPLWWDEVAYGSLAKNYISHMWDGTDLILGESNIRPPFFPIIWSILLRLGIGEIGFRFFLEFIPSVLSIFAIYLIGKEFYGKKIGIISAFIFSFLWIHLFYTGRLLTEVPSLAFLLFSTYFLTISLKKDFKPKFFFISIMLINFSVLIRYPTGIVFFVFLFFLIGSGKFNLIKNKNFWISGIMGMIPLLVFFYINLTKYGNIFPAVFGGDYLQATSDSFAFHILSYTNIYLTTPFFLIFLLGSVVLIFNLILGYDLIKKRNDLKGTLLLSLFFILFYGYFIFIQRGAEDRWLFPTALPLVIFAGYGTFYLYDLGKKYNKNLALILVVAFLFFGAYTQINYAHPIIEGRAQSFLQMRQGFEWMRENTAEESVVIGHGIQPYTIYYAERKFEVLSQENPIQIQNTNADYLVIHAFNPHPDYLNQYLEENQHRWQPVQAFFFDEGRTQPAFIIYRKVI